MLTKEREYDMVSKLEKMIKLLGEMQDCLDFRKEFPEFPKNENVIGYLTGNASRPETLVLNAKTEDGRPIGSKKLFLCSDNVIWSQTRQFEDRSFKIPINTDNKVFKTGSVFEALIWFKNAI